MSSQVVTGEGRLSYVHAFEPWAGEDGGDAKAKYSVTLLLPKTDTATKARLDAAIQAAYERGVANTWANRRPALNATLYDGDGVKRDGSPYGEEAKGCWVLRTGSRNRPNVVDANGQPILEAKELYSGCYGRIGCDFGAYSSNGNMGISCYLNNIQKLREGEPLGNGAVSAKDDFGPAQPVPPVYGAVPAAPRVQQDINPITGLPY